MKRLQDFSRLMHTAKGDLIFRLPTESFIRAKNNGVEVTRLDLSDFEGCTKFYQAQSFPNVKFVDLRPLSAVVEVGGFLRDFTSLETVDLTPLAALGRTGDRFLSG
jgi:hypothetical protein